MYVTRKIHIKLVEFVKKLQHVKCQYFETMKQNSITFVVLFLLSIFLKQFNGQSTCAINDDMKFDCYPRGYANRFGCISRGCCWSTRKQSSAVPSCFYPTSYKSYEVISHEKSQNGEVLFLQLARNSIYPRDLTKLKVDISYQTSTRLRVKITNALVPRYEPFYPKDASSSGEALASDTKYSVSISNDSFGFVITRKSSGAVLFDSRNIGGFTFSDQFLQMSAVLPSKYIYGLGEHQTNFLLTTNWTTFTLFNHDSFPTNNVNLYGSHPFYLNLEESGLSNGVFLLNSNGMDVILQPAPAITYRSIGGVFDFYFFLGPSPGDVIQQYTEVIGYPFFPPYWSLGFHLTRFGLTTLTDLKNLWRNNFDGGLPLEAMWSDIDYMEGYNDFTISPNYTGLAQFVDHLHDVGMKYVPILDAGVASREPRGTYPPYDDGVKLQIFILNSSNLPLEGLVFNAAGGTVFPDFTNPKTQSYWSKLLNGLYKKVQYDGLWLDLNEISNLYNNGSQQGCISPYNSLNNPPYVPAVEGGQLIYKTVCLSGKQFITPHYDVHNIHGLTESIVTYKALAKMSSKRPFTLTRSTFSGSGHFTAHWTGDTYSTFDDMKYSIGDILSFNLFGIPMIGADLCGFHGNTTLELCKRWTELGAFYPFSRNHNENNNIPQDPASLGILPLAKKVLSFRYKLLPYLYTLFWYAHTRGDTVLRPLFFEFPEDKETYGINRQFLWGPAFLINPVLDQGQTFVRAYFPKGTWFDAETLIGFQSSGKYKFLHAPIDHIPLYFRASYIIPFQEPAQTTFQSRKNPFGLYVALNETSQASGSLFWDDGETNDTNGRYVYNLLRFAYQGSTLKGFPIIWKYKTKMILNTINIMGLSTSFQTVKINNKNHKSFQSDSRNKILTIETARIDLSQTFVIQLQ